MKAFFLAKLTKRVHFKKASILSSVSSTILVAKSMAKSRLKTGIVYKSEHALHTLIRDARCRESFQEAE